jgi:hypothetical protein
MKGEIILMVDLFTRETILQLLPSRKQDKVELTILRRVLFERGETLSIRSNSAPELVEERVIIQIKNLLIFKHSTNRNRRT